ncbi:hypothetical protein BU24DRAFT_399475 [Aaosphaeria arxii CBS 175.79]|uniref:Zn(2)-C6 fungal-type domain-containing protein n=1 Tax=Aaosphaeria arxii CBS 175.79 TaxID=1450172 RepID=A0A6A5XE87_9PLEO|nr:uncharacterized protein BU24DRAFT_399475 [Aaosphaeria arxii CBS 175.79]KAF2011199.1 hypothetical protein BU24DRAFT_399475 [Aaosphaeria arxii CBS 175.79]
MTASTGKRSFRACLRCRRRKTRCDLQGTGDRKEPPCKSCQLSNNNCILVGSRRGQWRGQCDPNPQNRTASIPHSSTHENGSNEPAIGSSPSLQEATELPRQTQESSGVTHTDHARHVELRNPSDALEFLSRSDNHAAPIADSTSNRNHTVNSTFTTFDDYELVKTGVLSKSTIFELLQIYSSIYHPYCPIVPHWFLDRRKDERIQESEHFLLSSLLTIASRDSPRFVLVHHSCWNYVQRLLLDVFLSRSSTSTPRTVEGLLILAEWLPHIEVACLTRVASGELFGEDRLAWSLIGLAIRQAYMIGLDRGAFRDNSQLAHGKLNVQKRLVWHFVYLADRHISVRLGQSFWSRGPSLSSDFTADDFPSLKPKSGDQFDYSQLLQANLELVQILYNAHLILYPSADRSRTLVRDGNYARYLDDFSNAATTWKTSWGHLEGSSGLQSCLFITYQYVRLYVNAFSFQAVLNRATDDSGSPCTSQPSSNQPPLIGGIMSSPDGVYINSAIEAALGLLGRLVALDPCNDLRFLPSRFYLYGIYAAVLLHKAIIAEALTASRDANTVNSLFAQLVSRLREAAGTETHVCHTYAGMLERLQATTDCYKQTYSLYKGSKEDCTLIVKDQVSQQQDVEYAFPSIEPDSSTEQLYGTHELLDPEVPFPGLLDELTVSSFWPGLGDFI